MSTLYLLYECSNTMNWSYLLFCGSTSFGNAGATFVRGC